MESGGLQFNLLMISEEFGLSTTQMGNLVSIQYLAFILIPLLFGGLGDKYGKKIIIFLFALCFCSGCLAFLLSSGFLLSLAGAFLVGAGFMQYCLMSMEMNRLDTSTGRNLALVQEHCFHRFSASS